MPMPSEPRNQPSSNSETNADRSTAPFRPKTISPVRSTYCGSRRITMSGTRGVRSDTRNVPEPISPTEINGTPSMPEYSSAFSKVPKGPVLICPISRIDFTSQSSGMTPTSVCLYPGLTSISLPSDAGSSLLSLHFLCMTASTCTRSCCFVCISFGRIQIIVVWCVGPAHGFSLSPDLPPLSNTLIRPSLK